MAFDVVNPARGDCLWYHTTPAERVEAILRDGLRVNSPPVWQAAPEPWIYLSTMPWLCGEHEQVVLEVDLAGFSRDEARSDVGWPFVDGPGSESWERRWQLRVFRDVEAGRVRVMEH